MDSPSSGGLRNCALKCRSSSSLGESYSFESLPLCFSGAVVVVSLRFMLCFAVEEAWEGSMLGWTSVPVAVVTVHS